MEYMGPVDYWFWLGIKHGFLSKRKVLGYSSNPDTYLEGRLTMNNQTNADCLCAYKDGFYIGEELTDDEYKELTELNTSDKVENIVKNEKDLEEIVNVPIQGNC